MLWAKSLRSCYGCFAPRNTSLRSCLCCTFVVPPLSHFVFVMERLLLDLQCHRRSTPNSNGPRAQSGPVASRNTLEHLSCLILVDVFLPAFRKECWHRIINGTSLLHLFQSRTSPSSSLFLRLRGERTTSSRSIAERISRAHRETECRRVEGGWIRHPHEGDGSHQEHGTRQSLHLPRWDGR